VLAIKRLFGWEYTEDSSLLVPAAAFVFGVAASALMHKALPLERIYPTTDTAAVLYGALPIVCVAILGFFRMGIPMIPLTVGLKGYLLGRTVCSFFPSYGKGMGTLAAVALVGPAELALMPLLASVGASAFSRSLACAKGVRPTLRMMPLHIYLFRAAGCALMGGLAALYGGRLGRELLYRVIS